MKYFIIFFLIILLTFNSVKAQINPTSYSITGQTGVVTTTVPFLLITPDARSGGMADAGVAISPDANSIYWNPSKLAFAPDNMGFSASYTPWLRELVPDVSLSSLSGYKKLDDRSAIGLSFRYFSLGDINFTDTSNRLIKNYRPTEFSIDAGYARKLSDHFSIAATGSFIHSDLSGNTTLYNNITTHPANDVAVGFSAYYTKKINIGAKEADMAFGGNMNNIGPKLSYTNSGSTYFIPTNLKLGGYLNLHLNDENELGVALDFNKLLVPTPPVYAVNDSGKLVYNADGTPKIVKGRDPNVSVIQGMVQSFYDAPNGFSQEMALIDPCIAFEYRYLHKYSARIGYFYEDPNEGDRQYFTVGLGTNILGIVLDVSYLIPTNNTNIIYRSPLENTFRFSLSTNINKGKLVKN